MGRVVYNRKRHFFTEKDLMRILKKILSTDFGKPVGFGDYFSEWIDIELILIQLLSTRTQTAIPQEVFDFLRYLFQQLRNPSVPLINILGGYLGNQGKTGN